MILPKNFCFQNIKKKAEFKNLDDSEVLSSDFPGLKTSTASLTSSASTTSLASTNSTALFYQRTSWFWWLDHPWHQKDQYGPFFVEWIIKNPIFHWYLNTFLSEAVEASRCYFFVNWLMKCPYLLKSLGTLIQENYWSFYPSEPFRIIRFNMRHPVVSGRKNQSKYCSLIMGCFLKQDWFFVT